MKKPLLLAALGLLGCEPWCSSPGFQPSENQSIRLEQVDKAAAAYRDSILEDSDGKESLLRLFDAVQAFRAVQPGSQAADAFMAEHLAGLVRDFSSSFPTPGLREAAVRRALKDYRDHVLPRSTDAEKYLK
ncbi:MAG: hypothetical protein WC728_01705 [Elusimicrobiota bacterium]